jgi:hypothetical protein
VGLNPRWASESMFVSKVLVSHLAVVDHPSSINSWGNVPAHSRPSASCLLAPLNCSLLTAYCLPLTAYRLPLTDHSPRLPTEYWGLCVRFVPIVGSAQ